MKAYASLQLRLARGHLKPYPKAASSSLIINSTHVVPNQYVCLCVHVFRLIKILRDRVELLPRVLGFSLR